MGSHEKPKRWEQVNEELKSAMQKEIALMRELLANLHQEELSLMLQDPGTHNQLLLLKSDMMDRLSHLRVSRERAIEEIFEMLGKRWQVGDWEQTVPDAESFSCEVLSLRDQLMTLKEKMDRQQKRNQHLTEHPEYLLSLHHQEKARQEQARAKRKPIVATYQIKK